MKPLLISTELVLSTQNVVSCVNATIEEVLMASPRVFRSQADDSLFTQLDDGEFLKCRNGVLSVTKVTTGYVLVIWKEPLDIDEEAYQTWLKTADACEQPEVILCSPNISHNHENMAIHAILETENEFLTRFAKATQPFQFFDLKNTDEIFPTERMFFYTADRELLVYQTDTLLKVLLTKSHTENLAHLQSFKADLAAFYTWANEILSPSPQE